MYDIFYFQNKMSIIQTVRNFKILPHHITSMLRIYKTDTRILSILYSSYREIFEYYIPDEETFTRIYDSAIDLIFNKEIKSRDGKYRVPNIFEHLFRDIYVAITKSMGEINVDDLVEIDSYVNTHNGFCFFANNLTGIYVTERERFFVVLFELCKRCNIQRENSYLSLFESYAKGEQLFTREYILGILYVISAYPVCNELLLIILFNIYRFLAKVNGSMTVQFPFDLERALFDHSKEKIVYANERSIISRSELGMQFSKELYNSLESESDKEMIANYVGEKSIVKQKIYMTLSSDLKRQTDLLTVIDLDEMAIDKNTFLSVVNDLDIFDMILKTFYSQPVDVQQSILNID